MGDAKQIFHVRLEGGEERRFDLDQLDAAYKAGWIDETTMVSRGGSLRWVTLGELAGIEPQEEQAPYSVSPVALDPGEVPIDVDSMAEPPRPRRGKIFAAAIAVVVVAGLGFGATRARPGLASSIGHAIGARVAAARGEAAAAPAAQPTQAPITTVDARGAMDAKAAPTPAASAPAVPTPAASAPAASASSLPTLTATSLPDAKPAKKKRRGGRK